MKKVSLKFQEEGSVVSDVSVCIKSAVARIKSLAHNDGPFLQTIHKFETSEAPSAGTTTRNVYGLIGAKEVPQRERIRFINRLCDALNVRFEDTQHGSVKATSIANFNMWPIEESELDGFGDDDIGSACESIQVFLTTSRNHTG